MKKRQDIKRIEKMSSRTRLSLVRMFILSNGGRFTVASTCKELRNGDVVLISPDDTGHTKLARGGDSKRALSEFVGRYNYNAWENLGLKRSNRVYRWIRTEEELRETFAEEFKVVEKERKFARLLKERAIAKEVEADAEPPDVPTKLLTSISPPAKLQSAEVQPANEKLQARNIELEAEVEELRRELEIRDLADQLGQLSFGVILRAMDRLGLSVSRVQDFNGKSKPD
jgi:hypothetical protein